MRCHQTYRPNLPPQRGFSLVELAIVLVIVGLLVGGLLTGKALIRASELRSITTELNQYGVATGAFRNKYSALPGDMPNATEYWGIAGATNTCWSTQSTDAKTCDGDGNGLIDLTSNGPNVSGTQTNESDRFWQHLANGGFIAGSYTGVNSRGPSRMPVSYAYGSIWTIQNRGTMAWAGAFPYFNGYYANTLTLYGTNITTQESWNIDKKIDDGMPATGTMVVVCSPSITACTTGTDSSDMTARYQLSLTTRPYIDLMFRDQF